MSEFVNIRRFEKVSNLTSFGYPKASTGLGFFYSSLLNPNRGPELDQVPAERILAP